MLPPLSFAQIDTLLTVIECGSVSAAAARLHLTQPAISKRLHGIEAALGVRLFDLVGRHLQPTPAAHLLAQEGRRWRQELAEVQRQLSHARAEVAGTLSIGTSHHIGLHHLPDVLRAFVQQHPQVELDVHFVDSEAAHQAVRTGRLELAFLTLPLQRDPRLSYQPLWDDPLDPVCAPFHPLAQRGPLQLADLLAYPALLPDAHTYTSQLTLQAFAEAGLHPHANMNTNALDAIRMLVGIGAGWSVLPRTLIQQPELQVLQVAGLSLQRQLGMVWHPQRTLSRAAAALRRHWAVTGSECASLPVASAGPVPLPAGGDRRTP